MITDRSDSGLIVKLIGICLSTVIDDINIEHLGTHKFD